MPDEIRDAVVAANGACALAIIRGTEADKARAWVELRALAALVIALEPIK